MALEFSDLSANGSGSLKVFTYTGTVASLMGGGVPDRFKTSPNTAFIADCSDGTIIVEVNSDATALEEVASTLQEERPHFIAVSATTVSIGTDASNPSLLTGLAFTPASNGFEVRSGDGAVRNITGRTLGDCAGTISFQPNKTGGGTTVVRLSSQLSTDGTTWSANPNSLRVIEVPNNGETFKTAVSIAINWPDQAYIRFVAYSSSGGAVSFEAPSDTIAGNAVTGPSVVWELREL